MAGLRFPGAHSATTPDKPAVVMAESGASMSYAELDAYAARLAKVLRSAGLEVGDRVAIAVENRLEYPALQWGAQYAGLYYVPISTRLKAEEVAYIVADSAAKAVLLTARTPDEIVAGLQQVSSTPALFDVDGTRGDAESLPAALAAHDPGPLVGAVEGSDMMYSSGTTGRPKGISPSLTGEPLGTTSMIADLAGAFFGLTPESVYLSPAPMYHAAPSKWVQGVTSVGATAVLMERFDAAGALAAIERHGVTHSQWVPTMFKRLLQLPEETRTAHDTSSLVAAIHAAAPCPPDVKQAMIDWWGPIITEYYGGSEAIGMCMARSEEWLARPGTVGRAFMGELHIVDDSGEEVPVGQEGLICFGAGRPFEYHNDPEKTAEAYVRDGWATMGDVGRVDADGYLYLTDRKSNMIITGGVNVYPQETEDTLLGHPAVHDAAVIGVPNDDFGEEVRAVVQAAEGHDAGPELAATLIEHCRERLADVKCPRAVDFRDELPREPNGKLLKRKLRDEYWPTPVR